MVTTGLNTVKPPTLTFKMNPSVGLTGVHWVGRRRLFSDQRETNICQVQQTRKAKSTAVKQNKKQAF